MAKPCHRLLIWCSYGGIEYNCSEIFMTVLSDDGLCCTFNALNRRFIEKIQYEKLKPILNFNFKFIRFKSLYIFFHFKSKDHPFNKHMNSDLKANDWSPERGFVDMSLKNDLLGYPRPGIGKFKIWTNLTKLSSASEFHLF